MFEYFNATVRWVRFCLKHFVGYVAMIYIYAACQWDSIGVEDIHESRDNILVSDLGWHEVGSGISDKITCNKITEPYKSIAALGPFKLKRH
jgi:hypothetical protein